MADLSVVDWIDSAAAEGKPESVGGMGGFFQKGMRWSDYIGEFAPELRPHLEALRKDIVARRLLRSGEWHQNEDGTPLFSDGTVGFFSWRAWGDLMAAVWATELDADRCYMDFYMDCTVRQEDRALANAPKA